MKIASIRSHLLSYPFPAPIHLSNVMLLDPKTGEPTRVHRRVGKDGTAERVGKSGQVIPRVR